MRNENNSSHDWSRENSHNDDRRERRTSREGYRRDGERREGPARPARPRISREGSRDGNGTYHRENSTETRTSRPRIHRSAAGTSSTGYNRNQGYKKPYSNRPPKGKNPRKKYTERPQLDFEQPQPEMEGIIRLNKYIANAGICSRREADVLISTGVITVNDQVVTELGTKVQPGDVVKYNGRTLKNEKKVYILLNKPKGYITTADDPQKRKTIMELLDGAVNERIYPVGRLDRNTTGLLLITNDGEMTKKLTHPSFGAQKVYNAELDKPISREDMNKLLEGVELEDGVTAVDDVSWLKNEPLDKKKVGISLHSGKNRIIRRLFEALGYEVRKLDRVYFAGLTKKNLQRGHYRFLTPQEVAFLHMDKQ